VCNTNQQFPEGVNHVLNTCLRVLRQHHVDEFTSKCTSLTNTCYDCPLLGLCYGSGVQVPARFCSGCR
jgi:hypothetical protein